MNPNIETLNAFFNARGAYTKVAPATETVPIDQLFVHMGNDYRERALRLELLFLPDMNDLEVLQFFVALPFAADPDRLGDTARFLLFVNEQLPLSGYGLNESAGTLYFRYMMSCPRDELPESQIGGIANIVRFLVMTYMESIETLVTDERGLPDIKADFARRHQELLAGLAQSPVGESPR